MFGLFRQKPIRQESPPDFPPPTGRRAAAGFAEEHNRKTAERMKRLLTRDAAKNRHRRREERRTFSAVAELVLPDHGLSIDGVVADASSGGLTFRPAANYIEERTGEHVMVVVEDIRRKGVIRSTRVNGYGIQLIDRLTPEDLDLLSELNLDLRGGAAKAK